ncbi:MAG: hypothetical protein CO175_07065, partial [Verrucomicrobia bacterium CG_4_9_14_3_um_filter_43_20]
VFLRLSACIVFPLQQYFTTLLHFEFEMGIVVRRIIVGFQSNYTNCLSIKITTIISGVLNG